MSIQQLRSFNHFFRQWYGACTLGKIAELGIELTSVSFFSSLHLGSSLVLLMALGRLFSGAVMGWLQWKVLQKSIPVARTWVLVTSVASALGFLWVQLYSLLFSQSFNVWGISVSVGPPFPWNLLSTGLIDASMGFILGMAQLFILRQVCPKSHGWIAVSTLGFFASGLVREGLMTCVTRLLGGYPGAMIFWLMTLLGVMIYAILTARFLNRTFQRASVGGER